MWVFHFRFVFFDCGYICSAEGDLAIKAKYCSHMFHKDCILEWLQKRDECPVCRVNMVTNRDINKAATSVVGDMAQVQTRPVPGLRTPGSISRMSVEGSVSIQPSYAGFSGYNHPLSRGSTTPTRTRQQQQQQQQTTGVSLLSLTAASSQDNDRTIRRVGSAPLERRNRRRQDSGLRVFATTL